jgi:hypothetical protein
MNPLAHIQLDNERTEKRPTKSEEKPKPEKHENEEAPPPLRRHKSTRELQSKSHATISDDHVKYISTLPRSESTRRVEDSKKPSRMPSRGRTQEPLIDCSNPPAFAKGSLLATEEEEPSTLIQIDDRVKFSKGSLLEQKVARQKSVRDPLTNGPSTAGNTTVMEAEVTRRHVSLRRKGTKSRHVPLPSTSPVNSTLLRLDDTPERFHSRELLGRHVKPLVNFDSNDSQRIRK